MANYLIDVTGRPLSKGTDSIRDTFDGGAAAADLYYTCFLYNRNPNPDEQISIYGKLPADFSLDLNSSWDAPFDSTFGDLSGGAGAALGALAGNAAIGQQLGSVTGKATGVTRAVIGSAKTWTGNTDIDITLPIKIQAYDDTTKEIMEPMKRILKAVTPHLNKAGILIPPGPSIINFDTSTFGAGNEKEWASAMLAGFGKKAFYVQIGTWFKMFPAIIEGVSVQFDGLVEDGTGHPMFMEATFKVKSYLTPTKYDIDNWINIR